LTLVNLETLVKGDIASSGSTVLTRSTGVQSAKAANTFTSVGAFRVTITGKRTNVVGATSGGNTLRVGFATENTKSILAGGSRERTVRVGTASKLANSKSANKSRKTVGVSATADATETS
jgi:hypothetical protein